MQRQFIPALLAIVISTISAPLLAGQGRSSGATSTDLTVEETADLKYIREEEKLARDTYLVFFDRWGTTVFANIASSEQNHMDAMLSLLRKYQLPDPAAGNQIGEFTDPVLQTLYLNLNALGMQSELEALRVGGIIEETDIRDLKVSIARTTHPDIVRVYENLYCGSRNHLRAFASTITAMTGQAYTALVLNQAEVDTVLSSPTESCGR